MKNQSASENQKRAPICAAFVQEMRELFGDVRVLWVKEGGFEIGEPVDGERKSA